MPTGTKAQPDEYSKALTTIFRLKMQWLNLSKADVERLTEIPHGTFSRIINDKKLPDLAQLRSIAAAVKVPLPALMAFAEGVAGGIEPPFEPILRAQPRSPKEAYQDQQAEDHDPYDINSPLYWGGAD